MDAVFRALANRHRRRILDLLRAQPGSSVQDVADVLPFSRIGVMKHLSVLDRAGLIHSVRVGRKRLLYFNSVPIQMIHDRWTTEYSAFWASQLADVKYRVESRRKRRA